MCYEFIVNENLSFQYIMCHLVILLKKTLTCLSAVADPSRYRYLENNFLLASELQVLLAAEPLLKFLRPRVACTLGIAPEDTLLLKFYSYSLGIEGVQIGRASCRERVCQYV